ncbi:MAG: hypothetical protein CVU32_00415 [Betaproteobacteria bacterium HGW-Betaproteobacteria-5]|nr:MAG: hypothetical protein CVU32_00415 [Betaproteobacteria bacterium HGW-Betaproteobacteria-5]PKO41123.1 MAG: hypothetical protein CVU33_01015 [Betaproteobacteria bacterium HGW-Betaproteobacteria-6]
MYSNFSSIRNRWDQLGVVLSMVCLLHCLALPVLLAAFSVSGALFLHDGVTHQYLAFFLTIPALFSALPGFRFHRRILPMMLISIGIFGVFFAAFWVGDLIGENSDNLITIFSSISLIAGHILNNSFCRVCPKCSSGPQCSV